LLFLLFFAGFTVNVSCIFWLLGIQAVVLCQVEKAKEDMLNQLYSSVRFRNLLLPFIFILLLGLLCLHLSLVSLILEDFEGTEEITKCLKILFAFLKIFWNETNNFLEYFAAQLQTSNTLWN